MTDDCIAQARLYHAAADDGLLSAVTGDGRVNGGEGVKGVELQRSNSAESNSAAHVGRGLAGEPTSQADGAHSGA
jgi:hypothetical protein